MHYADRLIGLLDRLVEERSTVVVIERNLDAVARADRVIDLGPGAGQAGGRVMFEDTPEALARSGILTGEALAARGPGSPAP